MRSKQKKIEKQVREISMFMIANIVIIIVLNIIVSTLRYFDAILLDYAIFKIPEVGTSSFYLSLPFPVYSSTTGYPIAGSIDGHFKLSIIGLTLSFLTPCLFLYFLIKKEVDLKKLLILDIAISGVIMLLHMIIFSRYLPITSFWFCLG
jgi:phosphoglycerol transferase MdoB-like AlkP superfamily enzyme